MLLGMCVIVIVVFVFVLVVYEGRFSKLGLKVAGVCCSLTDINSKRG